MHQVPSSSPHADADAAVADSTATAAISAADTDSAAAAADARRSRRICRHPWLQARLIRPTTRANETPASAYPSCNEPQRTLRSQPQRHRRLHRFRRRRRL